MAVEILGWKYFIKIADMENWNTHPSKGGGSHMSRRILCEQTDTPRSEMLRTGRGGGVIRPQVIYKTWDQLPSNFHILYMFPAHSDL